MRFNEFHIKEDTRAALFPDSDADALKLGIDPDTGLYLTSTRNAHTQGSPYFGAVVLKNFPGKFVAQLHILNRVVPSIEQSVALGKAMRTGAMTRSYIDPSGQARQALKLGKFDSELEAAYALQRIRFSGDRLDDFVVEFLTQKHITKNLIRPWPPAIEDLPDFSTVNPISLKDYKAEKYLDDAEERQQAARKQVTSRQNVSANIQRAIDMLKEKVIEMIKQAQHVDGEQAEGILATLIDQFESQTANYEIKTKMLQAGNDIDELRTLAFFVENPKLWIDSVS